MGGGKTTAAINLINTAPEEQKFIFCTPYLEEVQRVKESCVEKNFVEPSDEETTKITSLLNLIQEDRNIVTTHALFDDINIDIREELKLHNYILIMDEQIEVIKTMNFQGMDKVYLDTFTEVCNEQGKVQWKDSSVSKIASVVQAKCRGGRFYKTKNYYANLLPIENFECFASIYILTFMFKGSILECYFKLFKANIKILGVKCSSSNKYELTDNPDEFLKPKNLGNLIHILDNEKMNYPYRDKNALSKGWYESCNDFSDLKKHTYHFFFDLANTPSKQNMWTTFVDYKRYLKGKGYTKGFVACNARASNKYRGKTSVAYLVNRFANPVIKNFFAEQGIYLDEEAFALSEMLQFIWRSAIRDGKEINIYIPSLRMRSLLVGWINLN